MGALLFTLLALVGSCAGILMIKSTPHGSQSPSSATAPVNGPAANQQSGSVSQVQTNQPYPSQQPAQRSVSPQQLSMGGALPHPRQRVAQTGSGLTSPFQQLGQFGGFSLQSPQQPMSFGSHGTNGLSYQPNQAPNSYTPTYGFQQTGQFPAMNPLQKPMYQQQTNPQQPYTHGQQAAALNMGTARRGRYNVPQPPYFDVQKARLFTCGHTAEIQRGTVDMRERMNHLGSMSQNPGMTAAYEKYDMKKYLSYTWWLTLQYTNPRAYAMAGQYMNNKTVAEASPNGDAALLQTWYSASLTNDKHVKFMASLDAAQGLYGDNYVLQGQMGLRQYCPMLAGMIQYNNFPFTGLNQYPFQFPGF